MTWPHVALGDLCRIEIGRTPARDNPDYWRNGERFPWLSISDMNQGTNIVSTKEGITAKAVRECHCRLVPTGTLLLSFKLSIGKVSFNTIPLYTNEAIAALHILSKDRIFGPYLYWVLQHVDLLENVDTAAKGNTLNKRKLHEIAIPLPPLPDQHRLAAILDAADALRAKRRAALAKLDALGRAVFLEMFGEPVGNERGWPEARLADLADIVSGVTKGQRFNGKPTVFVPYMRVANVQDGHVDLAEVKTIEALESDAQKYRLQIGDILLTEGGDPDKLGRGAIWHGEIETCIHQNHIFRVRLTSDQVIP